MRRALLSTVLGLLSLFVLLPVLSAAPAPAEKPAQKTVTVTLVRWPYT